MFYLWPNHKTVSSGMTVYMWKNKLSILACDICTVGGVNKKTNHFMLVTGATTDEHQHMTG